MTCVFWDFELDSKRCDIALYLNIHYACVHYPFIDGFGAWSQNGCNISNETDSIITCQCDHLTPFGVLFVSVSISSLARDHTVATSSDS